MQINKITISMLARAPAQPPRKQLLRSVLRAEGAREMSVRISYLREQHEMPRRK